MGYTRASWGAHPTLAALSCVLAACGGRVAISSGSGSGGGGAGATQVTTSSGVSGSGGASETSATAGAGGTTSSGGGDAATTSTSSGGVASGGAGGSGGVTSGGAGGAGGSTTGGAGSGGAPGPLDPTCAMGSVALPPHDQNMMSCNCAALGGVTIEGACGLATLTASYRPDVLWTLCDVPSAHATAWLCKQKSGGSVFACSAEQTTPCLFLTFGRDTPADPYLVGGSLFDGEGNEWSLSGQIGELTSTGPEDAWLLGASFTAVATRPDGTAAEIQITFGVCVAFGLACQI